MWRTEYGERILEGAEARLFAETLLSLLDEPFLNELDHYPWCEVLPVVKTKKVCI